MYRAERRRIRDRKFIRYRPEHHFVRAYAVCASAFASWDLFPPPAGYRPFNSNSSRTYTVSLHRQHSDWSKLVVCRDKLQCQTCGSKSALEAHHTWPQGAYHHLRYLLKNGITLCRPCHDVAYHAPEITPGQFASLASEATHINSNIESDEFWSYYTAGSEKGRVLAYGLLSAEDMCMSQEELDWFLSCARLNNFVQRSVDSARSAPIQDVKYKISLGMAAIIAADPANNSFKPNLLRSANNMAD